MDLLEILSIPCRLAESHKLALAYASSTLPDGATVVEIGTFRGGSAKILSCNPRVNVHTIDVFDSADPALLGPDSTVRRYIGDACSFAAEHSAPVDLLFIDGDHTFFGVQRDFACMRPLLARGATVAFHDYSRFYAGVRVYCDALAESGAIRDCIDINGMLVCKATARLRSLEKSDFERPLAAFLRDAEAAPACPLPETAADCAAVAESLSDGWQVIGRSGFGRYFASFFGLDAETFIDSDQAGPEGKYVVCSYAQLEISAALERIGVAPNRIAPGENVLSYGMYRDLVDNGGARLIQLAGSREETLFIEQLASMPRSAIRGMADSRTLLNAFKRTTHIDRIPAK